MEFYKAPINLTNSTMKYMPSYPNEQEVSEIVEKIKSLDNIINYHDITSLQSSLTQSEKEGGFTLILGDCAENLYDYTSDYTHKMHSIAQEIANSILKNNLRPKVNIIGRLAGQYAKPRSSLIETVNKVTMPSYMGDIINHYKANIKSRRPDPKLMLRAYKKSAMEYAKIQQFNAANSGMNMFIAHEAFLLPYEIAMLRNYQSSLYNASAHLLWIGHKTNFIDSAHIQYASKISNPIGLKVGPNTIKEGLLKNIRLINSSNNPGKILLIFRFGVKNKALIETFLDYLESHNINATYICDPMHGNTTTNQKQYKIRYIEDIAEELICFMKGIEKYRIKSCGVHIEMTPLKVVECTNKNSSQLLNQSNYKTKCDPRLNLNQLNQVISAIWK